MHHKTEVHLHPEMENKPCEIKMVSAVHFRCNCDISYRQVLDMVVIDTVNGHS